MPLVISIVASLRQRTHFRRYVETNFATSGLAVGLLALDIVNVA